MFFLKTGNLILNWVPSPSSIIILCLKNFPHNLSFPPL